MISVDAAAACFSRVPIRVQVRDQSDVKGSLAFLYLAARCTTVPGQQIYRGSGHQNRSSLSSLSGLCPAVPQGAWYQLEGGSTMAPRVPIPLRSIEYVLSPYQHEILKQGIEKLPSKVVKFVKRVGHVGGAGGGRGCSQPALRRMIRNSAGAVVRAAARRWRDKGFLRRVFPAAAHPPRVICTQPKLQNYVGYTIMTSIVVLPIW